MKIHFLLPSALLDGQLMILFVLPSQVNPTVPANINIHRHVYPSGGIPQTPILDLAFLFFLMTLHLSDLVD